MWGHPAIMDLSLDQRALVIQGIWDILKKQESPIVI
jgi:hypothetical protein